MRGGHRERDHKRCDEVCAEVAPRHRLERPAQDGPHTAIEHDKIAGEQSVGRDAAEDVGHLHDVPRGDAISDDADQEERGQRGILDAQRSRGENWDDHRCEHGDDDAGKAAEQEKLNLCSLNAACGAAVLDESVCDV